MANIEDIYELSPMQQGMLFHTLYSPDSGVYLEQFNCVINGDLDIDLFRKAWQNAVDHHHVLRTSFIWKEVDAPLQVVQKNITLPWTYLDWSNISNDEQAQKIETFLKEDRKQGFDLEQPPLMRCAAIRITPNKHRFVWSNHHILMDGWSLPVLIRDVISSYERSLAGLSLEGFPTRHYRDYILWLQDQSASEAEIFWRRTFEGFSGSTQLSFGSQSSIHEGEKYNYKKINFSVELSDAIKSFARNYQLTVSTIMQGAWGILLNRYTGQNDVVFGSTISGRPPDLAGSDKIVGLFINTVPVRTQFSPGISVRDWLGLFQEQQVLLQKFGHVSLNKIQELAELSAQVSLFDSIFVFENYPVDSSLREQEGSLSFTDVQVIEQTNYPLTVVANSSEQIGLGFSYDQSRFSDESIQRVLGHMQTVLDEITSDPDQLVSNLSLLSATEKINILVDWTDTKVQYSDQHSD